jgi:hypothetical protein
LNERTAFPADEAEEASDVVGLDRQDADSDVVEGVDFASRRAERGKMQVWLTAFTAAAAVAVLLVVSMSVLHAS